MDTISCGHLFLYVQKKKYWDVVLLCMVLVTQWLGRMQGRTWQVFLFLMEVNLFTH